MYDDEIKESTYLDRIYVLYGDVPCTSWWHGGRASHSQKVIRGSNPIRLFSISFNIM